MPAVSKFALPYYVLFFIKLSKCRSNMNCRQEAQCVVTPCNHRYCPQIYITRSTTRPIRQIRDSMHRTVIDLSDEVDGGSDMTVVIMIYLLSSGISVSFQALMLSRWGWDKMAAIFQTIFSNAVSLMKIYKFWLRFHWSLFPGLISNISALVQIMAWRLPGDKPLFE